MGPEELGRLLDARPVELTQRVTRPGIAALWHLRLVPASPDLVDLALGLPLMDTTRVRLDLGWVPRFTATEAVAEVVKGIATGAGGRTEPLAADTARRRVDEVLTGAGQRP